METYNAFGRTKESEERYKEILLGKAIPKNANNILCIDDNDCDVQWNLLYQVIMNVKLNESQVWDLIRRRDIVDRGIFVKREKYKVQHSHYPAPASICIPEIVYSCGIIHKTDSFIELPMVAILTNKNKNLENLCIDDFITDDDVFALFEDTPLHKIMWQITTKEQIDYLFTIPEFKTKNNHLGKTPLQVLLSDLITRTRISEVDHEKDYKKSDIIQNVYYGERIIFNDGIYGILEKSLKQKEKELNFDYWKTLKEIVPEMSLYEMDELLMYTVTKIGEEFPGFWTNKLSKSGMIQLYEITSSKILDKSLLDQILKDIRKTSIVAKILLERTYDKNRNGGIVMLNELKKIWEMNPSDFLLREIE